MRHIHAFTVQTDARGRLLLPKEMRSHLGVEPKGSVLVEARRDGSVVLRDPHADRQRRVREARGSFSGKGGSVDQLIAERRKEAKREQAA